MVVCTFSEFLKTFMFVTPFWLVCIVRVPAKHLQRLGESMWMFLSQNRISELLTTDCWNCPSSPWKIITCQTETDKLIKQNKNMSDEDNCILVHSDLKRENGIPMIDLHTDSNNAVNTAEANDESVSADEAKKKEKKRQGGRKVKKIKKEEVDDSDDTKIDTNLGLLIFAKLNPHSEWWPAIIIDHQKIGMKPPKNDMLWIFWFGDHKISEVRREQIRSFDQFQKLYRDHASKQYSEAISEAVLVAGRRTKRSYVKQDINSLIALAQAGLLNCSAPDPVAPIPDSVVLHLTSIKNIGKGVQAAKPNMDAPEK